MKEPDPIDIVYVIDWLRGIASGVLNLNVNNAEMASAALVIVEKVGREPLPDLPEGYLSPHFTLEEFTRSDTAEANGIDNTASPEIVEQLEGLAATMEKVRSLLGEEPVTISSGYRCPALNEKVGGVSNSAHLYGNACDFVVPAFGNPTEICAALLPQLEEWGVDQLIDECDSAGNRWVHLGMPAPGTAPRCECFTA